MRYSGFMAELSWTPLSWYEFVGLRHLRCLLWYYATLLTEMNPSLFPVLKKLGKKLVEASSNSDSESGSSSDISSEGLNSSESDDLDDDDDDQSNDSDDSNSAKESIKRKIKVRFIVTLTLGLKALVQSNCPCWLVRT